MGKKSQILSLYCISLVLTLMPLFSSLCVCFALLIAIGGSKHKGRVMAVGSVIGDINLEPYLWNWCLESKSTSQPVSSHWASLHRRGFKVLEYKFELTDSITCCFEGGKFTY